MKPNAIMMAHPADCRAQKHTQCYLLVSHGHCTCSSRSTHAPGQSLFSMVFRGSLDPLGAILSNGMLIKSGNGRKMPYYDTAHIPGNQLADSLASEIPYVSCCEFEQSDVRMQAWRAQAGPNPS